MTHHLQELEQDPFDPKEFVERFSWRAIGGHFDSENFDADLLHNAFENAIGDLQTLYENTQKKCKSLEYICHGEESAYSKRVAELLEKNKSAFSTFQELDEKINYVATKVVHLGDQLESVNTPRARAVEAQKLMQHFAEFFNSGSATSKIFYDPAHLHEAADVIQKLHLIAQELPAGKFDDARLKISLKYDEIERALMEEFVYAHETGDKAKMKEVAAILSHFKLYSQCIETFIVQSQMHTRFGPSLFNDIVPLCEQTKVIIQEVFANPDQVTAKFVRNIYQGKLQEHIQLELSDKSNGDRYLKKFQELYSNTLKLNASLSQLKMGNDASFFPKLTRQIFSPHLDAYISIEVQSLTDKSKIILNRYYDSINHLKKPIPSGGISDLKREFQAKLGTRNILVSGVEDFGDETFLSEEVAVNLLQESKMALQRCQLLSQQSHLAANACIIFDILLKFLGMEFLDYAVELGLQAIPLPDSKLPETKEPLKINFFNVAMQCNDISHLLEKQFLDCIVPLVTSTPKHGECLQKKKAMLEQTELKLHLGLDRSITAIIGRVKSILVAVQTKTDFKPDESNVVPNIDSTRACKMVVECMNEQVMFIRKRLDGKNVEAVLMELGIRFHRVVLEHLQQFQYSTAGAMNVICDVNEYRKCAQEFKIPLLNNLFETLRALCNLLVIEADNLEQVSSGDQLVGLDRSVIVSFIQLRPDCKTLKLLKKFKN